VLGATDDVNKFPETAAMLRRRTAYKALQKKGFRAV
jgi:hypothetical protein